MITPRPYQIEGVKAIEAAYARGLRRAAFVWATGLGKTVGIASVVKRRHERPWSPDGGRRSLIVAHRTELIEQAANKVRDIAPELSVGIVKAERNETRAQVVVASVQTLQREDRRRMIDDVGLVVIDEAHHAAAESYLRVLAHYGAWGDGEPVGQHCRAVALGATATMIRGDERALGDVWQDVVHHIGIAEGVRAGYLVRPRGIRVKVDDLDLANVKQSRGDYQLGDLGRAVAESMAPELIAKAILEHAGAPDDCGIIFAPTVAAARVIAEATNAAGLRTALVWGEMPPEDRREALRAFSAGELDWLASVGVLTEGTDLPRAKVAVMARPTHSRGLYIQMAGRVLRPYPGKGEAIILDVVGATKQHSLMSPLSLFGEKSAALREDLEDVLAGDEMDELDVLVGGADAGSAFGLDDAEVYATGPLVSHEVDLFRGSSSDWQRTYAGVWFLPAGERFIAIVPGVTPGTFDVTWIHATITRGEAAAGWIAGATGVHDLGYAMAYAEDAITASEKMTAMRQRPWKAKPATAKQLGMARRFGHKVVEGMRAGEVSALITRSAASRRIDPHIPTYAKGR